MQIQWEITRAIVCIAAWWVLFYRLHRPPTLFRRIVLLVAMPGAYAFWIFMPMSIVANSISWAAITVVFAFICGDLRRSLFTAFFYIGMEMSIDSTRSSMIAMIFNRFFTRYSPAQYLQYNLQYLFVFAVACFYYTVMKRYRGKPKISTWLLCVIPPLVLWVVMTYFIHIADITDPILLEQGINIYGIGFYFGLFGISLNLGILYLYINLEAKVKDRTLELEEQTAIAVQANRAKTEFLATMSHEIRTPLNAVIGLSEIELRDKPQDGIPGSSRNNIAQIRQSGSYLLGIINDILDISKIEAGGFELIPVVYETPSFIADTVNLNRVRLGSKPVSFALEMSGDFPLKLKGDELRVKQILNNLLSNAAKYTNEGTITLTVSSEQLAVDSDELAIRFMVRDTGIGIREEDMGKLFANYTQLDAGANRKTEGTGLGLAVTKKLAEMMGGGVSVESEYGTGSCFTAAIIQGIASAESIGEETAESLRNFCYVTGGTSAEIMRTAIPAGSAVTRALVVDDVAANLTVLRGLLAPYGLHVETASSGNEAVEMAQRNHYDLIFMDHMMPAMDGVEAAENLRNIEGFNTPIVAMTANAMRGMREFYLEHGFSDYLSKPVNIAALDEVIKKVGNGEWGVGSGDQRAKLENKDDYQHAPITNNNPTPHSPLPNPFNIELEEQLLDMLNHYRVSFENTREEDYQSKFDTAYFEGFTQLLESFEELHSLSNSDPHSPFPTPYSPLKEAGRNRDIPKIREILPAFCAALSEALREQQAAPSAEGTDGKPLDEVIYRLKKALRSGESKTAAAILAEIGTARLDTAERRLYFMLYGLLYEGNTEKALDAIYFWEKLHD